MSNTDDDSSHDNSSSDEESTAKPGINLTSFLFGNIDRDGKLEDDGNFLDETSKKKLGGLSTVLGLKNIIEEVKASTSSDTKVKDEDYEEGSKVNFNHNKTLRHAMKILCFKACSKIAPLIQ